MLSQHVRASPYSYSLVLPYSQGASRSSRTHLILRPTGETATEAVLRRTQKRPSLGQTACLQIFETPYSVQSFFGPPYPLIARLSELRARFLGMSVRFSYMSCAGATPSRAISRATSSAPANTRRKFVPATPRSSSAFHPRLYSSAICKAKST